MADKTPHYQWTIPVRGTRPWYDAFVTLQNEVDATVFDLKDIYFSMYGGEFLGDVSLGGNKLYNVHRIGIGTNDPLAPKGSIHIQSDKDQIVLDEIGPQPNNRKWAIKSQLSKFEILAGDDTWQNWNAAIRISRNGYMPTVTNILSGKFAIGTDNPEGQFEIAGVPKPKLIILPSNLTSGQAGIATENVSGHGVINIGVNIGSSIIGDINTQYGGGAFRVDSRDTDTYAAIQVLTRKSGDSGQFTVPFKIKGGAPTNTLFIDTLGNVGVHTNTPAFPFDHAGNARFSGDLRVDGSMLIQKTYDQIVIKDTGAALNEKYWVVKGHSGIWELLTSDDAYTEWKAGIRITRSQDTPSTVVVPIAKFGVWANNPQAKIEIGGSIGPKQFRVPVNDIYAYAGIGTVDVANHAVMGIGINCDFIGDVEQAAKGSGILFDSRDSGDNTLFSVVTKDTNNNYAYPLKISGSCPSNTLFLATDGKIGLHTNMPAYPLDQNGDTRIQGSLRISKTSDHLILDQVAGVSDEKLWVMKCMNGTFQFLTANDDWTQWNEILKVTRSGIAPSSFLISNAKVGIGQINPLYVFDVSGDSRILGNLFVNNPTMSGHAATKSYVDQSISMAIYYGLTAPLNPFVGQIWGKLDEPAETGLRIYWTDSNWHSFFMGGVVG